MPAEFSVAQFLAFLNDAMRTIVDPQAVAVVGEVAEFKVSQQKWVWFKLKDETEEGVMDCFWTTFGMKEPLEDGMKIRAFGYPKVHPRSGKFSFNIVKVELVGEGALKRSYELLKKKLSDEGLFAVQRKRSLPRFPETIGLITSREAAACTDFLRILNNRWSGVTVQLASVSVQGERAIPEILGAFRYFNKLESPPDVLVLTRGGGSMEDMRAFNSEEVARAVFSSKIPVVCGVGHERDESLADFVADVRASTPSNAAERVVPNRADMLYRISVITDRLEDVLREGVRARLDRVKNCVTASLDFFQRLLERGRRARLSFSHALAQFSRRLDHLKDNVQSAMRLIASANPEEQLRRGWSLVRNSKGVLVRGADQVDIGGMISVRLYQGLLRAEVKEKKSEKEQSKLL